MLAVSDSPIDSDQQNAWLKAATYGHPPTEWEFHPSLVGLMIEIDKPDHLGIIIGLCPDDATFDVTKDLASGKETVRFVARIWPWETVPSFRGYGPLPFHQELECLPMTTSSGIIQSLGGIP